jgi:hypothetical protein
MMLFAIAISSPLARNWRTAQKFTAPGGRHFRKKSTYLPSDARQWLPAQEKTRHQVPGGGFVKYLPKILFHDHVPARISFSQQQPRKMQHPWRQNIIRHCL